MVTFMQYILPAELSAEILYEVFMKDGIYYVTFRSNLRDVGNGTVVVKNETVNGGDFAYVYRGSVNGNQAILMVERHDKTATSVFGKIDKFNLILNVTESGNGYLLSGHIEDMPQMQISISAKFIGDIKR